MSQDWQADIKEFTEAMGQYVGTRPEIPPNSVCTLRWDLVREEMNETLQAIADDDLVEIADGIGDSIVVLLGTAIAYGINMQPVWDEIHKSNMRKADGPVRADGKKLKPIGWKPPDIAGILEKQGEMQCQSEQN